MQGKNYLKMVTKIRESSFISHLQVLILFFRVVDIILGCKEAVVMNLVVSHDSYAPVRLYYTDVQENLGNVESKGFGLDEFSFDSLLRRYFIN